MGAREVLKTNLGKTELLGSGGQGKVYNVPDLALPGETGPFVFKEYKPKVLKNNDVALRHSVGRLAAVRSGVPGRAEKLDRFAIWPLAVVLPDQYAPGACGVIMKRYPATCHVKLALPSGKAKMVDFTVQQYLRTEKDRKDVGLPAMADQDRWKFLVQVALLLRKLHAMEVVFGDVSAKNILINTHGSTNPRDFKPMFIDTDGCRIRGSQAALPQLDTPAWEPPEVRAVRTLARTGEVDAQTLKSADLRARHASKTTDVYKFGLLIERFLQKGVPHRGDMPPSHLSQNGTVRISGAAGEVMRGIGVGPDRVAVIRATHRPDPSARPTIDEVVEAMLGQPLVSLSR